MTTCLNVFTGGANLFLIGIPGSFSWRLLFQEDAKLLSTEKRSCIELKVRELATKLGISKPVELIEIKGLICGAQAQGNAIFPGRIGIAINPELVDELPEAHLEFLIAHELSHIKVNDIMWMGLVPGIVGTITTLAMNIIFPSSATLFSNLICCISPATSLASLIGLTVASVTFVIFSKWREECADKLGWSVCSKAAQNVAYNFFLTLQVKHIIHRNSQEGSFLSKLWRKFLITADGDVRYDIFHPSLKNRVNYLLLNSIFDGTAVRNS